MSKLKKTQLAEWFVKENSDCGLIKNYFDSELTHKPVTEDYFFKWLMRKLKSELIDLISNYSDDGKEFVKLEN